MESQRYHYFTLFQTYEGAAGDILERVMESEVVLTPFVLRSAVGLDVPEGVHSVQIEEHCNAQVVQELEEQYNTIFENGDEVATLDIRLQNSLWCES